MKYSINNIVVCWPFFCFIAAVAALLYILCKYHLSIYFLIITSITCASVAYVGVPQRVHITHPTGTPTVAIQKSYIKAHTPLLYGRMSIALMASSVAGCVLGYFSMKDNDKRNNKSDRGRGA
jgi:hypothetical protein